jgi:hypothetical protein
MKSNLSIEEIRAAIKDEMDRLWSDVMCYQKEADPSFPAHGIIEGLRRSLFLMGDHWKPEEGWKKYATYIDPPGCWVSKFGLDGRLKDE